MLLVEAETVSFLQGCDSRHEQVRGWAVWRDTEGGVSVSHRMGHAAPATGGKIEKI